MKLKPGDKVDVIDCSWSYMVGDTLEEHKLKYTAGMQGWTVVASEVSLPTPSDHRDGFQNNTIIRKGHFVFFIQARFLRIKSCSECGRPYEN